MTPLLTVPQFAEMCSVSERLAWRWVKRGEVPVIHPCGTRVVRITPEDASAFVAKWRTVRNESGIQEAHE